MVSSGTVVGVGFRVATGVVLAVAAAAAPLCAQPQQPSEPAVAEPATDLPALRYDVDIDGVEADGTLQDLLRRSSQLIALQDNPPRTEGRLKRRIEEDVEAFGKVLRSQGYYAGKVVYRLRRDTDPIVVELRVEPGPIYRLAEYRVEYTGPSQPAEELPQGAAAVGLEPDMPAQGQAIVDAQSRLIRILRERGHPLARVQDRQAVVDHDQRSMRVTVRVDQGPLAGYGPVLVEGLESISESYIRRLIDLEPGKRYDQTEVDRVRTRLSETELFTGIAIEPGEAVDAHGNIPILVRLTERKHRTVGGGVGWSSSEGFRGEAYWEHRNLLGRSQRLRLSATIGEIEQSMAAAMRVPHFRRIDQDLLGEASAQRESTDAYEELAARTYLGISRPLGDWKVSGGLSVEYSIVEERGADEEQFVLFGAPLTAARDATDSLLDPTEGYRLAFTATPYFGTVERNIGFVRATALGSAYYAIDEEARYVLAGRAQLGTIVGEGLFDIPASKRFYAGGGGSVRGYEFQKAGPLDGDGDPIGGRSLLEVGAEMRIRVTDSIGIVPFVDGGTVFPNSYPNRLGDMLWAAGLGGRYYTGFGPVRLDVAFPLNPRDGDDWFQIYVSLGQAF